MIELIFVIVILGILATVAIPKLAASRDDAKVVSVAQQVMTGMADIAAYATSHAKTESNLSLMSSALESLERRGILTIDTSNRKGSVKMGSVSECLYLKIDVNSSGDLLYLDFGNSGGDQLCQQLQKTIPENRYPMVLRGTVVVY